MADRYWVGGTGSWSSTNTANWSASSGGAGGASVPTAADNVYFDANSNVGTGAFTVTMADVTRVCNDFTASGLDGTMTLAGSSIGLTVSGSLTFPATNFICSVTGTTTFNATTTGKTITTNGVAFAGRVTFNGVGGAWTLGSALNATNQIVTVTNGTFDTSSSGNYAVTAFQFSSNNSNIRTINLNASTVTLSGSGSRWDMATSTNATLNAGTSTINCSTTSPTFAGGGLTYYNVAFTSTALNTASITGANTFNNLTVPANSTLGTRALCSFNANQTINGTLSTTGTAGNRRVVFAGNSVAFTLTINSAPSLTDADFGLLYVLGTAAPISGTRIGNLGSCTGVTFSTPKTVYWVATTTSYHYANNVWSNTNGGAGSTDYQPLTQDTAVVTNTRTATMVSGVDSLNYIGALDFSAVTSAFTFSISGGMVIYGNVTLGSGVTVSNTSNGIFFYGNANGGAQIITPAGKTMGGMTVNTINQGNGTVQLAGAYNTGSSTQYISVTTGTFDTQGYAVTAGLLASNVSTVRTIKLNASTVSLSGSSLFEFTTTTNLTFNAGTSTINGTGSGSITFSGGGQTFYNVAFTSTGSTNTFDINGANTFNNLTITAPASTATASLSFSANQTINETLTCAGASAVRRIFLKSSTVGTQRTLTVNSLSADDCDFRDIVLAGAAAVASPTRAGDCGNNSGITFPAAKIVYWNLAGSQDWSATGWATSSGGIPAVNNFPLAQDTAVFDNTGSAGTVTINAAWNIGTFDASLRTSAMTFSSSTNAPFVYGDWKFGTGITSSSTTGLISFAKNGTQTITSNGVQFGNPITINNPNAYVQLADALSLGATRTLTLTGGTFDAVTYNVTTGLFNNTGVSTIKMGSGTWTLSGVGTVWSMGGSATLLAGTSTIVLSDTSTSARTFLSSTNFYYNKVTIGGTTGTSTTTFSNSSTYGEIASTKTVAHTILLGSSQVFTIGKWSVTGTAGNVVTVGPSTAATAYTLNINGPANTGIDYLSVSYCLVSTTSPGEFYVGVNSTNTAGNTRVIFTATPTPRTLYWVGGTGNWSSTTKWSTSSGGASGAAIPTSLDAVIFDSASNATAYTATIDVAARCAAFTMAGPASGNVTWAGTQPIAFHGSVSFAATGITRTYSGEMNWAGNSSYTFTPNGLVFSNNATIIGIGSTWTLGSALTFTGLGTPTVTYGTFDTSSSGNYPVTCPSSFASTNSNVRTINLNASTLSFGGFISFNTQTNLTFNAGTSQINGTGTNAGLTVQTGTTFYNVAFTSTALAFPAITGANTFNNLTITGRTTIGIAQFSISANQTINGTLTLSAGTAAAYRIMLRSNTVGTTRTLTCAAVSLTDTDFRDITIAGAASPASGTRLGDNKGNSGITFPAAKTVYYRQTGSANWGATGSGSWSATSGGSADSTMFPLAQDTAVFPAATYPASGSTTTVNSDYQIGTIDMSLRTTNTMTLATSTFAPGLFGNWINGTGITISGTGTIFVLGRTTQQITSAGRSFTQPITIESPSGSVTLQDAISCNSNSTNFTLTAGTFDANGYNLTTTSTFPNAGFSSSNSNTRTLNIGAGTWTIAAGSSAWTVTSTNLTVTGTGTIKLTGGSLKTFAGGDVSYSDITLDHAGSGALVITGNNRFANISKTFVGAAFSIQLGSTTQTVGAFTAAGTAGNLLTITGTSAASPATLIYTGGGVISTVDYVVPTFVRAYPTTSTWFAGANSTNGGTLGWIFSAYSPGGNIYAVYIVESSTVSDAISGGFLYVSAVADSATATDNFLVAPSIFNAPVTNTATATDNFLVAPSTFNAPVTNTATATDSPSVAPSTFNVPVTDTATATDSILGRAAFRSAMAETATATDSILGGLVYVSAVTDTTTATDNFLVAPSTFNAPVTNTATATDAYSVAATFNALVYSGAYDFSESTYILPTGTSFAGSAIWSTTSLSRVQVNADGPGTGTAGFNAGGNYIAFGIGTFGTMRLQTQTISLVGASQITLNYINGTGSNGGVVPGSALVVAAYDSGVLTNTLGSIPTSGQSTFGDISFAIPLSSRVVNGSIRLLSVVLAGGANYGLRNITITYDGTKVTDSFSAAQFFITQIVDAATATDTFLIAPSTFNAPFVDTATITDVITNAGSIYNAPVTNTATATDVFIGSFLWNLIDDSQTITWTPIPTDTPTTWDLVNDTTPTTWQNINNVN